MINAINGKKRIIFYPIIWIIATFILLLLSPDLNQIVSEEGQIEIPSEYPTQQYEDMVASDGAFTGTEVIVVYHEEEGLSQAQADQIEETINAFENDPGDVPLYDIVSPLDGEQQADQLVSDDETLLLVSLELDMASEEYDTYRDDIQQLTAVDGLAHYQTGDAAISTDYDKSTQENLGASQWITIALVFTVLLSIFRSPLTPILMLILLGLSFLGSISIVSFLADWFGFPVSTYTEIFILAIIFGVGTDYCILLMRRFQEELPASGNAHEAMLQTFRFSTQTIFYGAITGFIGFATIGFADFNIFQSAVGVAVGIVVLLIGILAGMPPLMSFMGNRIFWPSKPRAERQDNWLWRKLGGFSVYRPGYTMLLVAAILAPLLWMYDNDISFNMPEEVQEDYESIQAYDLIADRFGEGDVFFTTLAVEAPEGTWEEPNALPYLELMAINLEKVDGVSDVRTMTRPEGERLEEMTIPEQADILSSSLNETLDGLDEISDGHDDLLEGVADGAEQFSEAEEGVEALLNGTDEALDGVEELQDGLSTLGSELVTAQEEVSAASEEIAEYEAQLDEFQEAIPNTESLEQQLEEAETARQEALETISERQEQLGTLQDMIGGLAFDPEAIDTGLRENIQAWQSTLDELSEEADEAAPDSDISEQIDTINAALTEGEAQMDDAVAFVSEVEDTRQNIESELEAVSTDLAEAEELLTLETPLTDMDIPDPNTAIQDVQADLEEAGAGMEELAEGLGEAVDGLEDMQEGTQELNEGLTEIQEGQQELMEGIEAASDGFTEIEEGLLEVDEGTLDVIEAIEQMEDFISSMADQPSHPLEGIFITDDIMENEAFDQLWEHYATPDDRVISFIDITMENDPYGLEAIETVDEIDEVAAFSLKETPFEDANILLDGIAAQNRDLNDLTNRDFITTASIMLTGIFLALAVLFRSIIMPLYVLFSLAATYFGAAAITEWIFMDLVGYQGLMWAVPFFSFVILMALGVDYSIFLITRFHETRKTMDLQEAMMLAMRRIGGIVLAAALILGGTFASLLASGVLTLLQISTMVVIGLLLYSLLLLPLFVPALATILGPYNWWPFRKK
ncbi:MMPL family transporter [Salicibibacter cibarius]|uniref:MMPL family transporter n=1 Tax=Salicibibacter cibarius TaxID=2743000 RepID=A0A7T6Z272_9BACI|nr:MMPL family transporter [Salicibibacter cibarius]QQK74951.1 MMPL family transporter [Salicibibacter cibarius]